MPFARILLALVACVLGTSSTSLAQGFLTNFTVSSWTSTITQVGGGTTTYLSTNSSNWTGLSQPNFVSASGNPSPTDPYGSVVAYQSFLPNAQDQLELNATGGGFSSPIATLSSLVGSFEVNVTAVHGIVFVQQDPVNALTSAWSFRSTSAGFGTGTVLTAGVVIGAGTWAIDYVSTTSSTYTEGTIHFAAVPGGGLAAVLSSLLAASRRRRRG